MMNVYECVPQLMYSVLMFLSLLSPTYVFSLLSYLAPNLARLETSASR